MFKNIFLCIFFVTLANYCQSKGSLLHIEEDSWTVMLKGEWMVEFYAPWCPACKALQPIWSEFASWSEDLDVSVGAVDITTSPGLSGRFMITALPSIYHVKDGVFRQYKGGRDREQFISFVEDRKWKDLDQVSGWRAPDSLQMSLLAQFFRLSMVLRNVHMVLTERYGLPVWASYLLFVAGTVMVGAMLGLAFVCCIDVCCGQKSSAAPPTTIAPASDDASKKDDDVVKPDSTAGDDDDEEEEEGSGEDSAATTGLAEGGSTPEVRKRRSRKAD